MASQDFLTELENTIRNTFLVKCSINVMLHELSNIFKTISKHSKNDFFMKCLEEIEIISNLISSVDKNPKHLFYDLVNKLYKYGRYNFNGVDYYFYFPSKRTEKINSICPKICLNKIENANKRVRLGNASVEQIFTNLLKLLEIIINFKNDNLHDSYSESDLKEWDNFMWCFNKIKELYFENLKQTTGKEITETFSAVNKNAAYNITHVSNNEKDGQFKGKITIEYNIFPTDDTVTVICPNIEYIIEKSNNKFYVLNFSAKQETKYDDRSCTSKRKKF